MSRMPQVTWSSKHTVLQNQQVCVENLRVPGPHVLRDFIFQGMDFPLGIMNGFFKTGNFRIDFKSRNKALGHNKIALIQNKSRAISNAWRRGNPF